MAKDNNIDYQMYLDYLDGKSGEPKPEGVAETPIAQHAKKEEYKPFSEAPKPVEAPDDTPVTLKPNRKLSRLEEIELKYNLTPDGEEKNVHLMTDEEFTRKYGTKENRVKHVSHGTHEREDAYEPAREREFSGENEQYRPIKRSADKFEDVFSYDSSKENTIPDEELENRKREVEDELVSGGNGRGGSKKGGGKGKRPKKKKWVKVLVAVLIVLGILAGTGYAFRAPIIKFVGEKILHNTKTAEESTGVLKRLEEGDDQNHGDIFQEDSASDTYSMESWLDSWQKKEGRLMYNDKIINVLLIGMDDPEGSTWGRSDSMIIVSIDTIHQKLKMTSIWRDTYGLIEVPKIDGHDAYDTHEKINGSNFYGGPECVVDTIESLYKVRIDGYVMTTFSSFRDLIDAMGGITVEVTEAENDFLQATAPVSWHASAGKAVLLNGKEALVYSRIRKLDSDVNRAERQRKVMSAMLDKVGKLSTADLFKTVTKYLDKGYVTTNFSKDDITGLGTKAVFGGWKDFEIQQTSAPISNEVDPEYTKYFWGGIYNGAWVWVVDIPQCAVDTQKFIYGQTFCKLAEYRHTVSEFVG